MHSLKKVFKCFSLLIIVSVLALSPLASFGAEQGKLELANCFDYYNFGSVNVSVSAFSEEIISSGNAVFAGQIVNNNSYPIVEGAVYAKVFRNPVEGEDPLNGPHVVDWFKVKDGISLGASGTPTGKQPLEFSWAVPAYALPGEYQISTYFVSADKFNLLGLSFTDDITGDLAGFSVSGEAVEGVYFDREGTTINGDRHYFVGAYSRVEDSVPAAIESTIINTTSDNLTVPVTWKIYAWDALEQEKLLRTETSEVTIPAGESAVASVRVPEIDHSVYYAVAEADYRGAKSIVGVRFVRENISSPRINFPAVTSYPLKAGEAATLFSCLHNTTDELVPGTLLLTLKDRAGQVIHSASYSGTITGDMMGLVNSFTPEDTYTDFTLTAELLVEGEVVDSAVMTYDCDAIGGNQCQQESNRSWLIGAGILLLLIIAILIFKKRRI